MSEIHAELDHIRIGLLRAEEGFKEQGGQLTPLQLINLFAAVHALVDAAEKMYTLYQSESELPKLERFRCPECGVERPEEYHLEYCQYNGPDFGLDEESEEESDNGDDE